MLEMFPENCRKNRNRFVKPASLFETDDCKAIFFLEFLTQLLFTKSVNGLTMTLSKTFY